MFVHHHSGFELSQDVIPAQLHFKDSNTSIDLFIIDTCISNKPLSEATFVRTPLQMKHKVALVFGLFFWNLQ